MNMQAYNNLVTFIQENLREEEFQKSPRMKKAEKQEKQSTTENSSNSTINITGPSFNQSGKLWFLCYRLYYIHSCTYVGLTDLLKYLSFSFESLRVIFWLLERLKAQFFLLLLLSNVSTLRVFFSDCCLSAGVCFYRHRSHLFRHSRSRKIILSKDKFNTVRRNPYSIT